MVNRLRRSILATPATKQWMFEKAARSQADVVFLDLEDSVLPCAKNDARRQVIEGLRRCSWGSIERAVRINSVDSPWIHDDVIGVVSEANDVLDTLIVPKVTSGRDVWWVDVLLTQLERKLGLDKQIRLHVVIENVDGLINVEDIAKSSNRLDALIFGSGDYSVSQGARVSSDLEGTGDRYPGDIWNYPRNKILVAARAAGIEAIDAVYADYLNEDGFERAATNSSILGFAGKVTIHPNQVPAANRIFSPTDEEVARARNYIEAYTEGKQSGQGATDFNGTIVDVCHVQYAQGVLERARLAVTTSSPDVG